MRKENSNTIGPPFAHWRKTKKPSNKNFIVYIMQFQFGKHNFITNNTNSHIMCIQKHYAAVGFSDLDFV